MCILIAVMHDSHMSRASYGSYTEGDTQKVWLGIWTRRGHIVGREGRGCNLLPPPTPADAQHIMFFKVSKN